MLLKLSTAAIAMLALGGVAHAQIGLTPAQACYWAAERGGATPDDTANCSLALTEETNTEVRARLRVNRGIIYLNRGDADRAASEFNAALLINPNLAEAHLNRGAALVELGDYGSAVDALTRALALNPADPAKAHYLLGAAHEELGDTRAAYGEYRQAAALSPNWDAPQRELARFQVRAR